MDPGLRRDDDDVGFRANPESRIPNPESRIPASMITFDKVSKRYGPNHEALTEVSFEIGAGEVVGIIGHNGAGKSTLLKIISLITEPTQGEMELVGRVGSLLDVGETVVD